MTHKHIEEGMMYKLEDLTQEQKDALVKEVLESPGTSKEWLETIVKGHSGPDHEKLADIMHAMMCDKSHPDKCNYYEEESLEDTWKGSSHIAWLGMANSFISNTGVDNFAHGVETILTIVEMLKKILPYPHMRLAFAYVYRGVETNAALERVAERSNP